MHVCTCRCSFSVAPAQGGGSGDIPPGCPEKFLTPLFFCCLWSPPKMNLNEILHINQVTASLMILGRGLILCLPFNRTSKQEIYSLHGVATVLSPALLSLKMYITHTHTRTHAHTHTHTHRYCPNQQSSQRPSQPRWWNQSTRNFWRGRQLLSWMTSSFQGRRKREDWSVSIPCYCFHSMLLFPFHVVVSIMRCHPSCSISLFIKIYDRSICVYLFCVSFLQNITFEGFDTILALEIEGEGMLSSVG